MNIQKLFPNTRALIFVFLTFSEVITVGCSSTAAMSKLRVGSTLPQGLVSFRLIDAREQDTLVYSQEGNTQYLGDNNFEALPIQLITARFNEKIGGLLKGKEITLLHFRARIADPNYQTAGMPIGVAIIGEALKLPQLGNPRYAGVSLRGSYNQKEFTGDESVSFYLGSGESEISEAFNAAVNKAATKLQALLLQEGHAPN
jgi:hypothetical protein